VVERLQARGIDAVAAANPLRSVAGDAVYTRDVVNGLGGPVVLVGHSYGGFVITEAAARNQDVVGLVYVAAFAPDTGESAFELSSRFPGSTLADALRAYPISSGPISSGPISSGPISSGGNELAIRHEMFAHQFCADVPPAQAELMAATQRPVTEAALTDELPTDAPAWKHLPAWFVFGEQDLNIPVALHRSLAERAGARVAREIAGASHAISVSRPEAVAATIVEAVTALTPAVS
jgi:pimeloyl-ACP methyl ester carboxylesterase